MQPHLKHMCGLVGGIESPVRLQRPARRLEDLVAARVVDREAGDVVHTILVRHPDARGLRVSWRLRIYAQGAHRILMESHLRQRVVGQLSPRLAGAGGVRGVLRSVDSRQGCATMEVATAAAISAQGHAARGQGCAAAMRARLENLSRQRTAGHGSPQRRCNGQSRLVACSGPFKRRRACRKAQSLEDAPYERALSHLKLDRLIRHKHGIRKVSSV